MNSPASLKRIYIADGQPAPQAQLDNFRAVLAHISANHADLDRLCYAGDIVDCGDDSRPDDGSYPHIDYGFLDALKDLQPVVSRDRLDAIPGNHDIDYNSDSLSPQWGAHYRQYLTWFDRFFYYTLQGNILQIHMGPMARNTGGNITDYVVAWCKELVRTHQDHVVIVVTHQPLQNTVAGSTSVGGSLLQSSRFLDWIGTPGHRVDMWLAGHSTPDPNNPALETAKVIQGCHFFGIDMNSGVDQDTGFGGVNDMSYLEAQFIDGAEYVIVNRWNVDRNAISKQNRVFLPAGQKIQTAGYLTFDGRNQFDGRHDILMGAKTIAVQPSREMISGTWQLPAKPTTALTLIVEDRSNDDVAVGQGVAIDLMVPGANTGSSSQNQPNLNHGYGLGGRIAAERTGNGERDFGALLNFYPSISATDTTGDEYTEAQLRPTFEVAIDRVRMRDQSGAEVWRASASHFLVGRTSASSSTPAAGVMLAKTGDSRSWLAGTDPQNHWTFYNDALISPVAVGSISSSGTVTSFNTTSDARMKDDDGILAGDKAIEILRLISIHEFKWKATGKKDIGAFAQELYEVYPAAVTPGETWAVDYSKLVPVLVSALQAVVSRLDNL